MRRFIIKFIGLVYFCSLLLYAADSPGITGTVTTLPASDTQQNAQLKAGWNLMGINANLTLDELKQQLDDDNLLAIISEGERYKKVFPDQLNTFHAFQDEKGYWIKIEHDSQISYIPKTYENKTIGLQKGWNIINPFSSLTLIEIKSQLGNKLEAIIGRDGIRYKKKYPEQLNTFTHFEEPFGYWIKVNEEATLIFR